MKNKILFFLLLFIPFMINAEELKTEWEKFYGTENEDLYKQILINSNDEYIVLGHSKINGSRYDGGNGILTKYDADGNLLWQNVFGGNIETSRESFNSMVLTEDDSIVVIGNIYNNDIESFPSNGTYDGVILKYDTEGNLLWKKNWGGNGDDIFFNIIKTSEEDFIVSGYYKSNNIVGLEYKGQRDSIILKFDKDGNLVWQKNISGNSDDEIYKMVLSNDNNYIICGSTSSTDIEGINNIGLSDIYIVKIDNNGNVIWQRNWGGTKSEFSGDIVVSENDEIILTGVSLSIDIEGIENSGARNVFVTKFDKNGEVLWQKGWGIDNPWPKTVKSTKITRNKDIIVIGYVMNSGEYKETRGLADGFVIMFDYNGNIKWSEYIVGENIDYITGVLELSSEEFLVYGYTDSTNIAGLSTKGLFDSIFIKYDKDGNKLMKYLYGGNKSEKVLDVLNIENKKLISVLSTESTDLNGYVNKGFTDALITKLKFKYEMKIIENEKGIIETNEKENEGIVISKPDEGYEVDKVIVKDSLGNEIKTTKLEDGTYSFPLYTDVSIEVLFKEKLVNPKTGVISYIGLLFSMLICSFLAFWFIMRKDNKYEL